MRSESKSCFKLDKLNRFKYLEILNEPKLPPASTCTKHLNLRFSLSLHFPRDV